VGREFTISRILSRYRTAFMMRQWLKLCSARQNAILWKNPYNQNMIRKMFFAAVLLSLFVIAWQLHKSDEVFRIPIDSPRIVGQPDTPPHNSTFTDTSHLPNDEPIATADATPHPDNHADHASIQPPAADFPGADSLTHDALDPSAIGNTVADNLKSTRLLLQAKRQLESSPPLQANLRYKVNLFHQELTGPGFYIQAGDDSQQWRMELQGQVQSQPVRLAQISDGRFFYRVQQAGDEQTLEFVDLDKLNTAVSRRTPPGWQNPWTSLDGLPGTLRHLAKHFQFEPVRGDKLGDTQVLKLVGRLRAGSLDVLNPRELEDDPAADDWNITQLCELPEHIPHIVQIVLGTRRDRFPLFPYQLLFYRVEFDERTGKPELKTMLQMEFFNLQELDTISPVIFQVESTIDGAVDATDSYIEQARQHMAHDRRNR